LVFPRKSQKKIIRSMAGVQKRESKESKLVENVSYSTYSQ
jgi:hypothetical protein